MSMTEGEDRAEENRAELTPDQPCAVCGAEHDPEDGTMVGRLDPDSDVPYGLIGIESIEDEPHEESLCNDCIKSYLLEIQSEVQILNPRQAEAAAYMLLGLELGDIHAMVNAREGDGPARGAVRDYQSRARRRTAQALNVVSAVGPILKGPGR